MSGTGEKFGRLCSNKANPDLVYNGMMDHETAGGTKIPTDDWRDEENGILLGMSKKMVKKSVKSRQKSAKNR